MQDTLLPPSFSACGTVLQTWRSDFGFVFGNNSLGDREKLQRLALPELGNGFVRAVGVQFDRLHLGSPSGSLRCVAYAVGADGAPGAFLKASDTLTLSSLPSAPGLAWFSFPEAAAFTDAVYVGIDLRFLLPGDSLAVPGTEDGCGSGCWPYETWSDGTRNPICDTYDLDDVDFAVAAAIDWAPRTSGITASAGTSVQLGVYPNPGKDRILLQAPSAKTPLSAGSSPAPPVAFGHPALRWQAQSIDGRMVDEGVARPNQGAYVLQVEAWPSGCYFLKAQWMEAAEAAQAYSVSTGSAIPASGRSAFHPANAVYSAQWCKP